jgi:hypothetical protein
VQVKWSREMPDGDNQRQDAKYIIKNGHVPRMDAPAATKGKSRSDKHHDSARLFHCLYLPLSYDVQRPAPAAQGHISALLTMV